MAICGPSSQTYTAGYHGNLQEGSNLKEFQSGQSPMIVWYIVSLLYSTPKDGLQEILINVDKEQ